MAKNRDHLKNVPDTKGTFHAKMGAIKEKNYMDLTEADILTSGGRNTQKNWTKKKKKEEEEEDLTDIDNHDGVFTHPEPDILECEIN